MLKHINYDDTSTTVSNIDDDCIQPNAIDIRVVGFSKINNNDIFELSEDSKKHRDTIRIQPNDNGVFFLNAGQYEFITEHDVTIGENEAGLIIPRSTLNRNGIFITSGLYDSGFNGKVCGVIHVNGPTSIKMNTRIAQFLIMDTQTAKSYDGSYGHGKELADRYEVSNA